MAVWECRRCSTTRDYSEECGAALLVLPRGAAWFSSISSLMRCASALVWPWLASGSVPPEDSIRISDHTIPVLMCTDATLKMLMLISFLLNQVRLPTVAGWNLTVQQELSQTFSIQLLARKHHLEGHQAFESNLSRLVDDSHSSAA